MSDLRCDIETVIADWDVLLDCVFDVDGEFEPPSWDSPGDSPTVRLVSAIIMDVPSAEDQADAGESFPFTEGQDVVSLLDRATKRRLESKGFSALRAHEWED